MQLCELQQAMQHYILQREPTIKNSIVGNQRLLTKRLGIYADAYLLRLVEILCRQFPVLEILLGSTSFKKMARAYLAVYPSRHFSVRYLGVQLANFLAQTEPYKEKLYYAEMANFEAALSDTVDAADAPRLIVADLTNVAAEAWPDLTFKLHPSVLLLSLRSNVPAVWQAISTETKRPKLQIGSSGNSWVLWRGEDLLSYYVPLSADAAAMLNAIKHNNNFSEICQLLCDWHDESIVATMAVQHLQFFIQHNLLAQ